MVAEDVPLPPSVMPLTSVEKTMLIDPETVAVTARVPETEVASAPAGNKVTQTATAKNQPRRSTASSRPDVSPARLR
jgi:hypothetical protein